MSAPIEGFRPAPRQQRIWRLRENPSLRAQTALLLAGEVDEERLRHALARVVARHEMLRTTFHQTPGLPLPILVVHESLDV
ncbi:MAG TPA: hypothetical protein VMW75_27860, partial [Thermoanaerobaculia bacterium]|nr:hypothetical protein [Thermoanaerobaculia bacterium]